ncbi:hypothetical protein NIES1031_20755 [Chroogloeocystis siderophila 5.2 s.c.1]|jgi:hypothetical protein|uniref:Uncharacterized protein n=1 Tax=Chroogloeocystis siderophila 5.2 s.c.1 TaxID=247279 RepID=A0A1U7HEY0_9CHRO|nr:hypothetical protein NIES1031_20755 [Chroogloeocystis siderophila 5.2 s.c.1]
MKHTEHNKKNVDSYNTFERVFYLFTLACISLLGLIVILPLFLLKQIFRISKFLLKNEYSQNIIQSKDDNNSED